LLLSAEAVSSAVPFFDPHPKKQAIAQTAKIFFITILEER
jgi:hypothetical protein